MKIAIYSPYLDTVGGGERYMLTIASVLSEENNVDVLLDANLQLMDVDQIKLKVANLQGIDLSKINFIPAPLGRGTNLAARLIFLKKYDWLFYLTDGSLFLSSARNSVIHFQVPFEKSGDNLWDRVKLSSWKGAIFNSLFTKQIVEQGWSIKGEVVYPPVDVDKLKVSTKKKNIISVGRFFGFTKSKKHEVMIEAFSKMHSSKELAGWSLHLCGGVGEGDMPYVEELRIRAKGLPIFFHPSIAFNDLIDLYSESSIYWHAAGFGETDPKKFEHFGITTVEAMGSGCVPVVINLGGQREIVEEGVNGFLWNDLEELEEKTCLLVKNERQRAEMSRQAVVRAQDFSAENFKRKIRKMVYG